MPVLTHDCDKNCNHCIEDAVKVFPRAEKPLSGGIGCLNVLFTNDNDSVLIEEHLVSEKLHPQQRIDEHEEEEYEGEV